MSYYTVDLGECPECCGPLQPPPPPPNPAGCIGCASQTDGLYCATVELPEIAWDGVPLAYQGTGPVQSTFPPPGRPRAAGPTVRRAVGRRVRQ